MLAGEIIAALEKAPIPGDEPAASNPSQSPFNVPPGTDPRTGNPSPASMFLTPDQLEFEQLYQAGAESMKYLLGKK